MAANTFLDALRTRTFELRNEVSAWRSLPVDVLLQKPAPESWSAVQCLDHLNGYGAFYLPHLERALQQAGPARSDFKPGWLGDYFAKSMQPKPDGTPKSKMKAFAKHVPPPQPEAAAVLHTFLQQQDQLLALLEKARAVNLNARVIPLSIAGWLRLKTGDVFRFLVAHNERHMAQARRAFSGAALPVGSLQPAG